MAGGAAVTERVVVPVEAATVEADSAKTWDRARHPCLRTHHQASDSLTSVDTSQIVCQHA